MLSSNKYQKPHTLLRAVRLLTDDEKINILDLYYKFTNIHNISIDDPLCIYLNAKENDIISIRNHNNDIYRLVK